MSIFSASDRMNDIAARLRTVMDNEELAPKEIGSLALRGIIWQICTLKLMIGQYKEIGFDAPAGMEQELEALIRQAYPAYLTELEVKLSAAKRRVEELKSREMQREDAEKEIVRLEALLRKQR